MAAAEFTANPPSQAAKKPRKSRRAAKITVVLFAILIAICWYIGVFGGNVRVIQPGRAYRSAQLTGFNYTAVTARLVGNDLNSVLERDHIRTMFCLRGGSPADDWYREEIDDCLAHDVDHRDVPFSARSLPPPETLKTLLDLFDNVQYPVLFHCQAGADRTGLVSTLYANIYEHIPLDRAEQEELTWRFGHIPVDKTRAMDEFFNLYRRNSDGLDLRNWIQKRYPQLYAEKQNKK